MKCDLSIYSGENLREREVGKKRLQTTKSVSEAPHCCHLGR